MKLGMPTLIEFENFEDNIRLCQELKLDFIELNMNLPIFTPEALHVLDIIRLKQQHDIEFTVHLPEELDLSSFHPSIRRGHLERCQETMEWAKFAGISTINMHLNNGIYFTLPDRRVWINFQIPFIQEAIEQLNASFDNFYLTWDVGHDAKTHFAEEPIFIKHTDRIKHMHLHDYNGKSDHQTLYSGQAPINERLELAQINNLSVVVEVKTSESLKESIERIRSEDSSSTKKPQGVNTDV